MAETARPAARADGGPQTDDRTPTSAITARERVRARIRSEVARLNPTDDARQALELIVETSVRYAEEGGDPKIIIVDHSGRPRTTLRDGQEVQFSLRDLVEELRAKHPTLFKGQLEERLGEVTEWVASVSQEQPPDQPAEALADQRASDHPARDWLHLRSDHKAEPEPESLPQPLPPPEPSREAVRSAAGPARLPAPKKPRNVLGRTAAALAVVAVGTIGTLIVTAPTEPQDPPAMSRSSKEASSDPPTVSRSNKEASSAPAEPAATGAVPPAPTQPQAQTQTPAPPAPPPAAPAPTDAPPSPPGGDPAALRGVPEVLDTTTLYLDGKIVPLFGVEWARGGGNPEDLAQYLRGREVVCRPAPWSETYRCEVDGQDLSRVVLYNGGGRATAEATPELKAAESQARSARAGLWGK